MPLKNMRDAPKNMLAVALKHSGYVGDLTAWISWTVTAKFSAQAFRGASRFCSFPM
jgi:hypothetical protein